MENEDLLIEKFLSKSTPAQGIRTEMKIKDFVELIISND